MASTEPALAEIRRTPDGIRVDAAIPDDLVFFEGHFPGRPIVPGVILLHWALEYARRELGAEAAPSALEALKFRSSLGPGQAFVLELGYGSERLEYHYECEGTVVASGRARFEAPPQTHASQPAAAESGSGPPLRLPYTGAMRLIDRIVRDEGAVTLCEARVTAQTPLCNGTGVPAWLALEWLAQGMAAFGGARAPQGARPATGFLTSARRIALRTDRFHVGERLWIRAEHLRGEHGAVAFACALGTGAPPTDRADAEAFALAHGSLTAFLRDVG